MRRTLRKSIAATLFVATSIPILQAEDIPRNPTLRWWKGNLHTHSFWSDGNDFPDMIADWYRARDYNFLALSDHNILSQGQRWIREDAIVKRGGKDVVQKYLHRFGNDWVEMRKTEPGENPNPESETRELPQPSYEVRLKPFSEYRSLVEESGKFLMIPAEEISDSVSGLPVHMNATNLQQLIQPLGGATVSAAIEANMRAANDQAQRLGREILVHLNHPNFGYGVTAQDLAHAVSEKFFEVYNGHTGVNQLGDDSHPSIERLWDIANTIRLGRLNAAPLFGVATDDSHHYHGGNQSPGRGWVMVRATHLSPESLIRAMKRGNFYASSGVLLDEVHFAPKTQELRLVIDAAKGVEYTTKFVGTTSDALVVQGDGVNEESETETPSQLDISKVGTVLFTAKGPKPSYRLAGNELYVRAIVTSNRSHPNPSYKGQKEMAWSQPCGWSLDD